MWCSLYLKYHGFCLKVILFLFSNDGIWNIQISTWVCHVSLRFHWLVPSCPKQFSLKCLFSLKQTSKSFQSQYHLGCLNHQLNFQQTKQKWFAKKVDPDLRWKILGCHKVSILGVESLLPFPAWLFRVLSEPILYNLGVNKF